MKSRYAAALGVLVAAAWLSSCGSSSSSTTPTTIPTPPPVPSASIAATGAGTLVLHPSVDPTFAIAMATPVRITESAGGSANWNFARISLLARGNEIERGELGASVIRAAGFSVIKARSNDVYTLVFRFDSTSFDEVKITQGFGDVKDGRSFTVGVPFNSFSGVDVNLTPLSVPANRVERF